MKHLQPIMVGKATAAQLFELDTAKFMFLVENRYLPSGLEIAPGILRWDTETLRKIANGGGSIGWGDIDW